MRAIVSILVGLAVFAGCAAAWWFYWPVWQIEARVKTKLPEARAPHFTNVTYNRATHAGCGYVNANNGTGGAVRKTHFVLMPDGSLQLDPNDPVRGTTLQQLEVLRKHANYLTLVYTHCAPR
jgi:hypothetical protein